MGYLYIKLKKLEDHNMFKIYVWSGERGEYFQVTLGIWKPTITIQIGTINYDKKNSRRTNLKNT